MGMLVIQSRGRLSPVAVMMIRLDINAVRAMAKFSTTPSLESGALFSWFFVPQREQNTGRANVFARSVLQIDVHADANFAESALDKRSASVWPWWWGGQQLGFISCTQHCATVSTTEAEYVATGEGINVFLCVHALLQSDFLVCVLIFLRTMQVLSHFSKSEQGVVRWWEY